MPAPRSASLFVVVGFVVLIASVGAVQTAAELGQGERPRALDIFFQAPTVRNLRAYERDLEESSLVGGRLRPWVQYAQFAILADAGEKALVGRDGWLFYRPGFRYETERPHLSASGTGPADPLPAITSFRDQLAQRGIRLVVVPVPNKESIYPERLSRRAEGLGVLVVPPTRALLDRLQAAGIEVVDLFAAFGVAKPGPGRPDREPLYLAQDSHWSPAGMRLAARTVANRLVQRSEVKLGNVEYDTRPASVHRFGDVLQMLQVPQLEGTRAPETLACEQVVRHDTGATYRDAPDAPVLILGDSFLRIYEQDDPGSAGFVAHLARELKQPLTSLIGDGGASTLVRQELYRRPALLAHKKIVIWEFVERDIRYGAEGWQVLPLPAIRSERK